MNPYYVDVNEKRCPKCSAEISEWNFMGRSLDNAVIDNESGAITYEVKTNCLSCESDIYGVLWLVEINNYSKFKKLEHGL